MRLPFDEDRLESTLNEVTNPLVTQVECLRIELVEPLGADRKGRHGRLDEQVVMLDIRTQAHTIQG